MDCLRLMDLPWYFTLRFLSSFSTLHHVSILHILTKFLEQKVNFWPKVRPESVQKFWAKAQRIIEQVLDWSSKPNIGPWIGPNLAHDWHKGCPARARPARAVYMKSDHDQINLIILSTESPSLYCSFLAAPQREEFIDGSSLIVKQCR